MRTRSFFRVILLLAATSIPALGLVAIGPDESDNLAPPLNAAPWTHVCRLDNPNGGRASGVYLGNRYVLTADHVDPNASIVHLNGMNYARDDDFTPVRIGNTDLRLMRLLLDPGLPALPIISSEESDSSKVFTAIGYGVGKGPDIPLQGWNWADDSSQLKRWGTNTTLAETYTDPQSRIVYVRAEFDLDAGPEEMQLASGDSGCGWFQQIDGIWKLFGIGADVDTMGKALYDKDPATPGNQPDRCAAIPLRPHALELKHIRSGYNAWSAAFSSPVGVSGADPDGDGMNNLLEFAFGLDPLATSPASLSVTPSVRRGGSTLQPGANPGERQVLFVRRDDFRKAGLDYTVQFSSDRESWTDSYATPTKVADSDHYEIVAIPFPRGAAGPKFYRVVVSLR